jgi:hypothetical protein
LNLISKIKGVFTKFDNNNKSASVSFYPTQIIIVTYDNATTGVWLSSAKLTKLGIDVTPEILGQTLRKHFNLTEYEVEHPTDFKKHWNTYKMAAGFKTNKETYKDSKQIGCTQTKTQIILTPNENQYNTGYLPITESEIVLPSAVSDNDLGIQLIKARDCSTG